MPATSPDRRTLSVWTGSAAVVAVALVPVMLAPVPPASLADAERWTHRELADHLTRFGVPVRLVPSARPGTAYLVDATRHDPAADADLGRRADEGAGIPGVIASTQTGSAAAADKAWLWRPTDPGTFEWGPWYFQGDEAFVRRVRGGLRSY